jgi:hypothetical protein
MTVQFIVKESALGGIPTSVLVLDNRDSRWQIADGSPDNGARRTNGAKLMIQPALGKAPLPVLLEEYFTNGSYHRCSPWTESAYPFDDTVSKANAELRMTPRGAGLDRRSRLARIARVADEQGIAGYGADDDIPPDAWGEFMDATGEVHVVMAPNMGYPPVNDARRAEIIAELERSMPVVVIASGEDEEVTHGTEDLPGSPEGP